MEESFKELQLLPTSHPTSSPSSRPPSWPSGSSSLRFRPSSTIDHRIEGPTSLDLQLSISLRPIKAKQPMPRNAHRPHSSTGELSSVEAVRWQASEQIKLATAEKAYAERVREMTRREMEMAQSEFARARHVWERAREEIDRVERLREKSTARVGSTCLEITCHSCRQKFRT